MQEGKKPETKESANEARNGRRVAEVTNNTDIQT